MVRCKVRRAWGPYNLGETIGLTKVEADWRVENGSVVILDAATPDDLVTREVKTDPSPKETSGGKGGKGGKPPAAGPVNDGDGGGGDDGATGGPTNDGGPTGGETAS